MSSALSAGSLSFVVRPFYWPMPPPNVEGKNKTKTSHKTDDKMNPEAIASIIGVFTGGLVATIAGHFLSISREHIIARIHLAGHIGKWIGMIDQPNSKIGEIHADFAPHVMGYCGKARRAFLPPFRNKFVRLCDAVSKAQPNDADYREKIFALLRYV